MLLVATTRENVSPSLVLELLKRIGGIIKVFPALLPPAPSKDAGAVSNRWQHGLSCRVWQDYCGLLSEEAVRKNFVLLYELLDEVIDYGYPQNSSSEALKEFVLNEPTVIKPTVR